MDKLNSNKLSSDQNNSSDNNVSGTPEASFTNPTNNYQNVKVNDTTKPQECNALIDPKEEKVRKRLEEFYEAELKEDSEYEISLSNRSKYYLKVALGGLHNYIKSPIKIVPSQLDYIYKLDKKENFYDGEKLVLKDNNSKEIEIASKLKAGMTATESAYKLHSIDLNNDHNVDTNTKNLHQEKFIYKSETNYYSGESNKNLNQSHATEVGDFFNIIEEKTISDNNYMKNEGLSMVEKFKSKYYYNPFEEEDPLVKEADEAIDRYIEIIAKNENCKDENSEKTNNNNDNKSDNEEVLVENSNNSNITNSNIITEEKNNEIEDLSLNTLTPKSKERTISLPSEELDLKDIKNISKEDNSIVMASNTVNENKNYFVKSSFNLLKSKPQLIKTPEILVTHDSRDNTCEEVVVSKSSESSHVDETQINIDTHKNVNNSNNLEITSIDGSQLNTEDNSSNRLNSSEIISINEDQLSTKSNDDFNAENGTTDQDQSNINNDKDSETDNKCDTLNNEKSVVNSNYDSEKEKLSEIAEEIKENNANIEITNQELKDIPITKDSENDEDRENIKNLENDENNKKIIIDESNKINIMEDLKQRTPEKSLENIKKCNIVKMDIISQTPSNVDALLEINNLNEFQEVSLNNIEPKSLSPIKLNISLTDESNINNNKCVSLTTRRQSSSNERSSWICPICNISSTKKKIPMICCDKCDVWHHFKCVGITRRPNKNDPWYCGKCCNVYLSNNKKRKLSNDDNEKKK